jgi:hypothetical protein
MLYNVRSAVLLSQETHVWGKILMLYRVMVMWLRGHRDRASSVVTRGYEVGDNLLSHN